MLTDIKAWLGTSGIEVEENLFLKPPGLPYMVFLEDRNVRGSDNENLIADRNINIELYAEEIDIEAENKIEVLLNEKAISYKKNRTWIDIEDLIQTMYDFNLNEKL